MNNKEILELLEDLDDIMYDSSRLKNILRLDNNLINFEVINRILIEIQSDTNKPAFELKSRKEWELENRTVIEGQQPIYITVPVYQTCYIDAEKDVEITDDDKLTYDELVKAVELGLVIKTEDMSSMSVIPVFDIRQTKSLLNKYEVKRIRLSTSKILEMTSNLMKCTIQQGNVYKYIKDTNTLITKKGNYTEIVDALSSILSKYLINNKLKNILLSTKENSDSYITNDDLDFIYKGLTYAINTLLGGTLNTDISIKNNITANKFIYMVNCIQCLASEVINYLMSDDSTMSGIVSDYISNISRIKKAEAILAIMEANDIHKVVTG